MKKFFVIYEDGIYYVLDSKGYPNEYLCACFVSDSEKECTAYADESYYYNNIRGFDYSCPGGPSWL